MAVLSLPKGVAYQGTEPLESSPVSDGFHFFGRPEARHMPGGDVHQARDGVSMADDWGRNQ